VKTKSTATSIVIPDGVYIESMVLRQGEDSCDMGDTDQRAEVEFVDAGGGYYHVFKSERWASNPKDMQRLGEMFDGVCNHNDVIDKKFAKQEEAIYKIKEDARKRDADANSEPINDY
jgi:hypothetical protein